MRKPACFSSALALAVALCAAVPAVSVPPDAAAALVARAVGATPLMDDLRELCDRIGGRPAGSPANDRAVEWAAAKLREAGLEVRLEPFTVPALWLPGPTEAASVSPEPFPLRVAATPFSASTPGGKALEARVLDAGDGLDADYVRLGGSARGAIALVRNPEMRSVNDLFGEYMRNGPILEAAAKAQVAAVFLESSRPRGLLYRHPMNLGANPSPIPVALLSREHFERLERLASKGEVRASLRIDSRTGPAYESRNVVAEIRGREKPKEVVLLGAHLDGWDLGTGANDNGVNVALAIDVARGMKALGLVPRRTVRFVLFNAEEQGMWGSAGYVKRHAAEMENHVAAVIFDVGSGRTTGFYLNGREELRGPLDRALSAVTGLEAGGHVAEAVDGTDNFDFLLSGVPNLVASQDWDPYLPDYHAESDTFDKVSAREARANAAIASAVAWGFADAAERPAPRQTRTEVEKLLVDAKLVEQMKAMGQWEDWIAGKRGVSK
jgi:Iap family predicted aminopeptidase